MVKKMIRRGFLRKVPGTRRQIRIGAQLVKRRRKTTRRLITARRARARRVIRRIRS